MPDAANDVSKILQYILAAQYTRRYQEIVMRMPPSVLYDRVASVDSNVESVIHAYIDLCAEELHVSGQIPTKVWDNWQQGILAGMRLPAIDAVWRKFHKTGPYDELRSFLDNHPPFKT